MLYLLVIFALVLQLSITTASFRCLQCNQTSILNSQEMMYQPGEECSFKNETSTMCMATIRIDYAQNNTYVSYDGFSHESSNISTRFTTITHSMLISFDTSQLTRTLQVYCFRNESCYYDIAQVYEVRSKYNGSFLEEM